MGLPPQGWDSAMLLPVVCAARRKKTTPLARPIGRHVLCCRRRVRACEKAVPMAADPHPTVGELLRRYRGARGYTQEELAERARLSPRAISDLERGVHRAPQSETLHLLAQALELPAHERDAFVAAATSSRRHSAPAGDRPIGRRAQRLPALLTPLIGRERERAALAQLLQQPDVRLVTLSGPAGVGKTRLAIEVAAESSHLFTDGVVFVALAPIADPGLVPATIAQALSVRLPPGQLTAQRLAEAVGEHNLLLLLDNFEQVTAAAPFVAELLVAAAGLKAVVTSRAALRLQGERRFPVAPLAVPDERHAFDPPAMAQVPSVALFVHRAQTLDPSFALTRENTAAVAGICRRLDGLPLAIVLAAARSAVLPPAAMLARLDHRLAVLRHGPADLPMRHRALHDALAWSYDLLPAGEQALFRQLAASGESGAARAQHAAYFLAAAERAAGESTGPALEPWLDRIHREHDNLRAALRWALERRDADYLLRLGSVLAPFWRVRGYAEEGLQWLETAVAFPDGG